MKPTTYTLRYNLRSREIYIEEPITSPVTSPETLSEHLQTQNESINTIQETQKQPIQAGPLSNAFYTPYK